MGAGGFGALSPGGGSGPGSGGNLMKVPCVQECLRSRQRSCEEEAGPGETKEESLGGRELVTEEVA